MNGGIPVTEWALTQRVKIMNDAFERLNPKIIFFWFLSAIVFTVVFFRPLYVIVSALFSCLLLCFVRGRSAYKTVISLFVLFILLTLINPLFSTKGSTVLFTYFSSRLYTLEALEYGAETAGIFVSVMMLFSSFNKIMTGDKLTAVFGTRFPSLSLIFTMVLRLIPEYEKKARTISGARYAIGKAPADSGKKQTVKNSTDVLSSLTSFALENSLSTADSMRSRGYGMSKKTDYIDYSLKQMDIVYIAIMMILFVLVIALAYKFILPGVIAYSMFLSMPCILNAKESIKWRALKSKI